jgi:large subunit ribosomal protein L25
MDLTVQNREKFGKAMKALRLGGIISGELYGRGVKNEHLSVALKDFQKVFKEAGANTVVNLVFDDGKRPASGEARQGRPALIHEVVRNYLTNEIENVDFYQVRMDEVIKAKVPLAFMGEAPAIKEKGAILNKAVTEIEVEALPADLPHRLSVNLAVLQELNQSIYVKDLVVPANVKILLDLETVIVTATPPLAEEEVVPATPLDVTAVKVESEEKKAERAVVKAEKVEKTEKAEKPEK